MEKRGDRWLSTNPEQDALKIMRRALWRGDRITIEFTDEGAVFWPTRPTDLESRTRPRKSEDPDLEDTAKAFLDSLISRLPDLAGAAAIVIFDNLKRLMLDESKKRVMETVIENGILTITLLIRRGSSTIRGDIERKVVAAIRSAQADRNVLTIEKSGPALVARTYEVEERHSFPLSPKS